MKPISELMGSLKWSIMSFNSTNYQYYDLDTLKSLYELASTKVPTIAKGATNEYGNRIVVCPYCNSEVYSEWNSNYCGECGHAIKYTNE